MLSELGANEVLARYARVRAQLCYYEKTPQEDCTRLTTHITFRAIGEGNENWRSSSYKLYASTAAGGSAMYGALRCQMCRTLKDSERKLLGSI